MPSAEQKRRIKNQFEILSTVHEVQRMVPPKINMITSKREIQVETQGRKIFDCAQTAIGWTEEYCQYLDSLVSINFLYTATSKARERYENNLTLGVSGQGPKLGPIKNRQISHKQFTTLSLWNK